MHVTEFLLNELEKASKADLREYTKMIADQLKDFPDGHQLKAKAIEGIKGCFRFTERRLGQDAQWAVMKDLCKLCGPDFPGLDFARGQFAVLHSEVWSAELQEMDEARELHRGGRRHDWYARRQGGV